jgi:alpha-galactosidase
MNRDVIAVDQDWGGRQGYRLRDDGASEVWVKPMSDGGWAVVLLNRGSANASIQLRTDIRGVLSRDVPGHGVVMLRIS